MWGEITPIARYIKPDGEGPPSSSGRAEEKEGGPPLSGERSLVVVVGLSSAVPTMERIRARLHPGRERKERRGVGRKAPLVRSPRRAGGRLPQAAAAAERRVAAVARRGEGAAGVDVHRRHGAGDLHLGDADRVVGVGAAAKDVVGAGDAAAGARAGRLAGGEDRRGMRLGGDRPPARRRIGSGTALVVRSFFSACVF